MTRLQDITVSAPRSYRRHREFNGRTHCVCAMYSRELGPFQTDGIGKVIIQACEQTEPFFEDLVDVYGISLSFDYKGFWNSSNDEQKHAILSFLHEGLSAIGKRLGWDCEAIDKAFHKLQSTNLDGIFDWGRIVSSPNRKMKAQVRYYYGFETVRIFARVWKKGCEDLVSEYLLAETEAHEWYFVPLLGKLRWANNAKLILHPRSHERYGERSPIEIEIE
ncbi:MAG: hypothetical protein AB1646_09710 [Thermodesulfobacteriota bacterium]